jgi:hypothetical protein
VIENTSFVSQIYVSQSMANQPIDLSIDRLAGYVALSCLALSLYDYNYKLVG